MLEKWTSARANEWASQHKWVCGFNYIPSSAVNFLAMWHPETFDPETIKRELGWASQRGYNSTRVNLQYIQWKADPAELKVRLEIYLDIAAGLGLSTVICLFDDCEFSGTDPQNIRQPEPRPSVHNSRAHASPGRVLLVSGAERDEMAAYVADIVATYGDDERVLFWDLYNEPGNTAIFSPLDDVNVFENDMREHSLDLVKLSFETARSENPMQPITSGAWLLNVTEKDGVKHWDGYNNPIDQYLLENSDIITFHAYCPAEAMTNFIERLAAYDRPLYCTEWMARTAGSYLLEQLPILHKHRVGCYQWGLVQGKSQTHLPWPDVMKKTSGFQEGVSEWFHDVFWPDGRPYSDAELALVHELATKN